MKRTCEIRPMESGDLPRVSELSAQLGYPVSVQALERRFLRMAAHSEQALLVAQSGAQIVGWIHVHPQLLLEADAFAEIGGLVVDQQARRTGAGRALVAAAQRWAQEHGFERIRVRSNINREEAHDFYPALGFVRLKTQHTYELRCGAFQVGKESSRRGP